MQSIETIKGLFPSVNIKSVILNGPGEIQDSTASISTHFESIRSLSVKVKTTAITTAKTGKKFKKVGSTKRELLAPRGVIDYSNYLRVCVIQCRSPELTRMLQTMGEKLFEYIGPTDRWEGNSKFDDLVFSNILNVPGTSFVNQSQVLANFKREFMKIQTKKLFGEIDSPLLEKTDADGKQIYSVPLDFNFTINQTTPKHLSYFAIPYLDIDALASGFNSSTTTGCNVATGLKESDFRTIANIPATVSSDTIFRNGIVAPKTYFYKLGDGTIHTGPVHRMQNGSYMTGGQHSAATSRMLTVVPTNNVKVQDFRKWRGMLAKGIMNDFRDDAQTVKNILKNLQPRDRSLNPNNNAKDPYISDLFLASGTMKTAKFMFFINMDYLLTENSMFGKLVKTNNAGIRSEIFNGTKIKSLKIYRQSVKEVVGSNSVGAPNRKYAKQNIAPVGVVDTGQEDTAIMPTSNCTEETNMSYVADGIRCFSVSDANFSSSDRGRYQYVLEIKMVDKTLDYFRNQIKKMEDFIATLKNYESDMLNSLIRPKEMTDNPYVDDPSKSISRKRTTGGYDARFGNLTPNFALKMKQKYNDNIQAGILEYMKILRTFSYQEDFNLAQETNLKNFLGVITSPTLTNPNNVNSFIHLLQQSVAKISSHVEGNVRMTDPVQKKADYLVGFGESVLSTHGAIEIKKEFLNTFNLSAYGNGGYDYLSLQTGESAHDSSNQIGLKTMDGKKYRFRVVREILKYFNTSEPNLTLGMTAQRMRYAGGDKAQNTSFSFLSPSIVRLNELPVDVLNGGQDSNPVLMTFVETKLVLNKMESDTNGAVSTFDTEFKRDAYGASAAGPLAFSIAPPEQRRYFAEQQNLISTPQPPSLANAVGAAAAMLDGNYDEAEARRRNENKDTLPSMYPGALLARLFKKCLDRGKSTVDQMNNITLFDMNQQQNFLNGIAQSVVSGLPNQIKCLFITISKTNGGANFYPTRQNIFNDPEMAGSSSLKYKLLSEVQYLESFGSTLMSNRSHLLMTSPMWKTLNADVFSKYAGQKILCRLKKYEIPNWGITRPPSLDVMTFDEHFILQPDAVLAGADIAATPGATLDDVTRNALAAAGWDLTDEEYALFAEFGSSFAPDPPENLTSQAQEELASRVTSFKDAITESKEADNFVGPVDLGLGRLPQLRQDLIALRVQIAAAEELWTAKEDLKESNERARTLAQDTLDSTDSTLPRAGELRASIGQYNNVIARLLGEIDTAKMSFNSLKLDEANLLQEILEENESIQTAMIYEQVRAGVHGACELPDQIAGVQGAMAGQAGATSEDWAETFEAMMDGTLEESPEAQPYDPESGTAATTQSLQAAFSETITKMMGGSARKGMPDWTGVVGDDAFNRLETFQSYMTTEQAAEYASLMEEIGNSAFIENPGPSGGTLGERISSMTANQTSGIIRTALQACQPNTTPHEDTASAAATMSVAVERASDSVDEGKVIKDATDASYDMLVHYFQTLSDGEKNYVMGFVGSGPETNPETGELSLSWQGAVGDDAVFGTSYEALAPPKLLKWRHAGTEATAAWTEDPD